MGGKRGGGARRSEGRDRRGDAPGGGFYSRRFTSQESVDLESRLAEGLRDEIALLRVSMRRVFDLAAERVEAEDDPDAAPGGPCSELERAFKTMNFLGLAAQRLANLLKVQQELGQGSGEAAAAIRQALAEVVVELREAG